MSRKRGFGTAFNPGSGMPVLHRRIGGLGPGSAFAAPIRYGRYSVFRRTRTPQMRLRGFYRRSGYYGRFRRGNSNWMPELKFKDFSVSSITVPNTAAGALNYTTWNSIANGTGESERIGRKVTLRYIQVTGDISLNESIDPNTTADVVRFIILVDKQTNGVSVTLTELLQTVALGEAVNAPYLLENSSRFKILTDRRIPINAMAGGISTVNAQSGEVIKTFSFQSLCDIPLEFDNVDGAFTGIKSNSLHMYFVSKRAFAQVKFTARVRFSDN